MKRCALIRKTPLKRTGRLRPMSKAKAAMNERYRDAVNAARVAQLKERGDGYCVRCGRTCIPGPHHTHGRVGENLLKFILICWRPCHVWINEHQKEARKEGLIQ